ncbi:hypothetical protein SAMN05216388_10256 [Halorientalis persicus]|uniref:Uncharacterized protein n=1 Tax=Halorientalis persicus TaxID=1367881 RepID=A0A1H8U0Q7_9EURY|nr:hypothetical protein SAMN05216388_10256 [Halorientalis persicus]
MSESQRADTHGRESSETVSRPIPPWVFDEKEALDTISDQHKQAQESGEIFAGNQNQPEKSMESARRLR